MSPSAVYSRALAAVLGSLAALTAAAAPAWTALRPAAVPAATEAFVDDLVARLSLEEKVAQMIQADIDAITPADLAEYPLGSVLAGGNAAPGRDVHAPAAAWLELTDAFHRAALAHPAAGHAAIPLLFGIDAVHGHAKVPGATIFPHNVGLGAMHDPALMRRIGAATAAEVSATGIDWTFAPTVAVARDVRWGRAYESYSESPDLVRDYAVAMVSGLQGVPGSADFMAPGHTLVSVKHFLGDGGTRGGRDQGETEVSESDLSAIHGAAYPAAIGAGAMIVMASYNSWNGTKLHGSHYLLTDVLKERLGFEGFVVGDWNAHEQIPGCTKYDCPAAILAGVDMLMAPDSWKRLYLNTLAEVRDGRIPVARIDDAVRRILRVKAVAGLFARPAPASRDLAVALSPIGSSVHRALAREAVRESLVLLKNAHATLPLQPRARVLVVGEAADSLRMQTGGWTLHWQGNRNTNADLPGATTILAGIRAAVESAGGRVEYSELGPYRQRPDVAVVVFGEGPYAEFEGDRETLAFNEDHGLALQQLRQFRAAGIPTVAVFLSGRPLWVSREINAADAFVAAWLPGSEGAGVADLLFRAADGSVPHDFTGRLPFSWPDTAMPVSFATDGAVNGAAFPRSFGLDYQSSVPFRRLSESPRIPPQWNAPPDSLVALGHVIAPWSVFVADDTAEVHLTTQRQSSPLGAVVAEVTPDGFAATWNGSERGMLRISGRTRDLRPAADDGGAVRLRYRVSTPPEQRVELGLRCSEAPCGIRGGAGLDVTRSFTAVPTGAWRELVVPLACFRAAGADLSAVEVPFTLVTAGHFGVTIGAVSLQLRGSGAATRCP
jgi:beta-glucosidase